MTTKARSIEEILEDILAELQKSGSRTDVHSQLDPYHSYLSNERIAEHKKRKKAEEERNKRRVR